MRTGSLVVAATLLLVLAGCVPVDSKPSTSPSASATPVFASDAEALAAAEKAYAAYLKVSEAITGDGGASPDRIDPYVTAGQAPREHETYAYFSQNDFHTVGTATFSPPSLEQIEFDKLGAAELTVYTCVNASSVRVLDASGTDVTPANREDLTPLEVTLVSSKTTRSRLLISESSRWSGSGVCS